MAALLVVGSGTATVPCASGGQLDRKTFDVARIPPLLAKDADLVVREDLGVFEVLSSREAVYRVRVSTTVMTAAGRNAGELLLPYDSFHKVRSLNGWILDGRGREIRRLRNTDIADYSAIQGFSLYEDGRIKYAQLFHDQYPYTVIYEYEMAYDGILGWPSWWPMNDKGPVESSIFEIRAPADLEVRQQAILFDADPKVIEDGGRRIYQWSVSNQPKFELEPLGPSYREQAPHVLTGPGRFEIAGVPGDMSSWNAFGSWLDGLWKDRAHLPDPDVVQIRSTCAGATTDREKARRLYEYLQSKTRYVSVQLGIGGWQPFDASYVSRLGYGDCKALTNYMKSLLGAAGIEAFPAFVMAGQNEADVVAGFPSNQFNHVILFVPFPEDTLWLECTSQNCAFGELGTFTEDRNTLVVMPDGGRIVRTPATYADQNRQSRKARVVLGPVGQASIDISSVYTGDQQGDVRLRLSRSTPRERDEWLRDEIEVPSFTIARTDFSDLDRKSLDLRLAVSIQVPALASSSGPRLFLRPSILDRWTLRLPKAAERKYPVRLPYAYIDTDTISYQLPEEYMVESAPPDVRIETPSGAYEATTLIRGPVLEYRRRLEMRRKSIDVGEYEGFRQFLDKVVQADQAQVVLVRKT